MKHAQGISFGYTEFYEKNIKLPLLKNLHIPTKSNRTASVFMLEYKQRQIWNPKKISYKTYGIFFSIFVFY